MSRSIDPRPSLGLAGLLIGGVAVAALAVVAMAAAPSPAAPGSSPSPAVTPVATPVATPVVTPVSTPTPTDDGGGRDAIPFAVELDTFDSHAVSLDVVDHTGSLTAAVSGAPGDNPTADGLEVVNLDERTVRVAWVDFPIDNRLALFVDGAGDHLRLLLIRPEPTEPTDAIGFDRQVVLTFDRPVDAATVETAIQAEIDG